MWIIDAFVVNFPILTEPITPFILGMKLFCGLLCQTASFFSLMPNRSLGLEVEKTYDLTWNKDGQDPHTSYVKNQEVKEFHILALFQ